MTASLHQPTLNRRDTEVTVEQESPDANEDGTRQLGGNASASEDELKKKDLAGEDGAPGAGALSQLSDDTEANKPQSQGELAQGRQVGTLSATFLIVNRIVGTGVFSTTSTILTQSGSVGMSLLYWVIGAIVAFAGFSVYSEFATMMPKNGGELNYLQHAYRKPRGLAAVMYAAQAFLLGQAAGNAYSAGQYFLKAGASNGRGNASEWPARAIGVGVLFAALIMHSTALKWGLRFQNALGTFKLIILTLIAFSGFAALAGRSVAGTAGTANFKNAFVGTRGDVFSISNCLYNAIWSYQGYSNCFYSLGEVQNPARLMRRAGPLALLVIAALYVLVQVAYFAAIPLEGVAASEQIIAADYFNNMFGGRSRQALSVFVALSAVANVFSVVFSQGRVNQALGRDGLIPFGKFFASSRPFNTPMAGLAWHVAMTLIILLAPPPGDTYQLVLALSSYPLNVVNAAVGLALLATYVPRSWRPEWARDWASPYRASLPVTLFFSLISIFLCVGPFIPPERRQDAVYAHLWYALAPVIALGLLGLGALWWVVRWWALPKKGGYVLEPVERTLSDGNVVTAWEKRKLEAVSS